MAQSSLVLAGTPFPLEQLPALLVELDLMPLLLRRHIERSQSAAFLPSQDQQVEFQQTFLARERITDQASLAAWLQRQGISEPQMSQRLFKALQLELFQQATFGPRVEPIFLERKASLDRVTYSLLRVRERAKAVELHLRLEEEEATFSDLASAYSEGIEQQVNGLIGPMELGRINPVLAERLRISTPGQLWPPFEAEGWWVLLRHERHWPAQLDAAMSQRLLIEMYELWMQEKVSAALADLQVVRPAEDVSAIADQPAPLQDLPPADALQPKPSASAEPSARRGLLQSLFRLD
jgi:hypothetical protein